MNCPHCGMPVVGGASFPGSFPGGGKFFEFGCGRCYDSDGVMEDPTPACLEIARLKEQNAMLETVAMQGADERNSLKARVQYLENKLKHVNFAFAEYVKKETAR